MNNQITAEISWNLFLSYVDIANHKNQFIKCINMQKLFFFFFLQFMIECIKHERKSKRMMNRPNTYVSGILEYSNAIE